MKAFTLERYGGPEVARLRDVAEPTPGPREVLVRVKAAGLNPVDFKIREGKLAVITKLRFPAVLGNELAGTVVGIGAEVTRFAVGDDVCARVDKTSLGAFAELACVHESFVAKKPIGLGFAQAAALPLAGLTALQVLRDELRVGAGFRLFLPGGAGGVGTFAIQLARHFGAEVTTTASERGRALVERLGATTVIDYTKAFPSNLPLHDGAFDLVAGDALAQALRIVRRGGRIVSIAGIPEPRTATQDLGRGAGLATLFWFASAAVRLRAWRAGIDYRYFFMHPSGADLTELGALVDAGKLEVVIDRVFPFADITEAFAYLESGHAKGKVVVER